MVAQTVAHAPKYVQHRQMCGRLLCRDSVKISVTALLQVDCQFLSRRRPEEHAVVLSVNIGGEDVKDRVTLSSV